MKILGMHWAVWVGYIFLIVLIGVPGISVIENFVKDGRTTIAENDKKNCLGIFNTIPCHQLKIEELLLESRRKEMLK